MLQIYVNNYRKMIVLIFSLIFGTAAGIAAFILLSSGDLRKFRDSFTKHHYMDGAFPILTASGAVLENKEELDAQLDILHHRLDVKKGEIVKTRTRIVTAAENMEKLLSTSTEVKKYYGKLKLEIARSERDCTEIQRQIGEFKRQQLDLQDRIKRSSERRHKSFLGINRTTSSKSLPS